MLDYVQLYYGSDSSRLLPEITIVTRNSNGLYYYWLDTLTRGVDAVL